MTFIQPHIQTMPASVRMVLAFIKKIDKLQLPPAPQREMEQVLCEQASVLLESFTRHNPGHGRRTAAHCARLGRALGLSSEELHDLTLAGLLHDVGLLTLDPGFLARPDTWDAEDYVRVQSHPRIGAELLTRFAFLTSAAQIIAHHHERWDGNGYPFGLRGPFIPLGARVLAIADAYDAVQVPPETDRYLRQQIALRIVNVGAGSQFDPTLVALFNQAVRAAPPDHVVDSYAARGKANFLAGG